jgi:hypothetical protein
MSISITIAQPQVITLEDVVIEAVRDIFVQQRIVAKIKNVPRPIVLWEGSTEYAAASAWTNETALARAQYVLSLSAIPFE